jgi:hypothetical protein
MDSDDEEELDLKEIPNVIKKIPTNFHSTKFAPRPVVLDIMRKANVQKELEALEEHCKTMDQVMGSVVNSMPYFYLPSLISTPIKLFSCPPLICTHNQKWTSLLCTT